jgi:hypothetical protein
MSDDQHQIPKLWPVLTTSPITAKKLLTPLFSTRSLSAVHLG